MSVYRRDWFAPGSADSFGETALLDARRTAVIAGYAWASLPATCFSIQYRHTSNRIRPPFALEAFGDLEQDVLQSIARIQASPFITLKDRVRGFIYDCATGRLNEVLATGKLPKKTL